MDKVTVIGAGAVGATCANVIAHKDVAKEVILIDVNPRITSPPNKKITSSTKKVLNEVLNVRVRVLFNARLMISARSRFR